MEKRGHMKLYQSFNLGEGINKRQKRKIIRALKKKRPLANIYLLCARQNSQYLLEIMTMEELFRAPYDLKKVMILGFTNDQAESFVMVRNIIASWSSSDLLGKGNKHLWA